MVSSRRHALAIRIVSSTAETFEIVWDITGEGKKTWQWQERGVTARGQRCDHDAICAGVSPIVFELVWPVQGTKKFEGFHPPYVI